MRTDRVCCIHGRRVKLKGDLQHPGVGGGLGVSKIRLHFLPGWGGWGLNPGPPTAMYGSKVNILSLNLGTLTGTLWCFSIKGNAWGHLDWSSWNTDFFWVFLVGMRLWYQITSSARPDWAAIIIMTRIGHNGRKSSKLTHFWRNPISFTFVFVALFTEKAEDIWSWDKLLLMWAHCDGSFLLLLPTVLLGAFMTSNQLLGLSLWINALLTLLLMYGVFLLGKGLMSPHKAAQITNISRSATMHCTVVPIALGEPDILNIIV